jgi:hypothetical protein
LKLVYCYHDRYIVIAWVIISIDESSYIVRLCRSYIYCMHGHTDITWNYKKDWNSANARLTLRKYMNDELRQNTLTGFKLHRVYVDVILTDRMK